MRSVRNQGRLQLLGALVGAGVICFCFGTACAPSPRASVFVDDYSVFTPYVAPPCGGQRQPVPDETRPIRNAEDGAAVQSDEQKQVGSGP